LKVTVDRERKPVPLIVSVCGVIPTARDAGARREIVGIGLLVVTVNVMPTVEVLPDAELVTFTW
jgi:hypothetical protein